MWNRSGNTTDNLCFRYRFRDVFSRFRCCVYNGTGPLFVHVSVKFQQKETNVSAVVIPRLHLRKHVKTLRKSCLFHFSVDVLSDGTCGNTGNRSGNWCLFHVSATGFRLRKLSYWNAPLLCAWQEESLLTCNSFTEDLLGRFPLQSKKYYSCISPTRYLFFFHTLYNSVVK